ncbi:Pentatricopeptide repeat [Dillenia turbinata]|uniref:Pentatricopeptide repeat n=1 Tax=Dillenia turbinata TaxID=194707 RepID=A0AAN8UUM9_9MAGN
MRQQLLHSSKTFIIGIRPTACSWVLAFHSSIPTPIPTSHDDQLERQSESSFKSVSYISSARVGKLIASQSDPLLAKEIFDLASRQPNFHHSLSSILILISKLGRSGHFSLLEKVLADLLRSPASYSFSPPPDALFTLVLRIYRDAQKPREALQTFYSIPKFNCKPLPKHLNLALEALVIHPSSIQTAFDLFKVAHSRYEVAPNTKSYNILMRAFCLRGDISVAYSLFNQMFKRDVVPSVESYRILMQALCRKSQVNTAVDLLEDMLNKGFVPETLTYTTILNSLCRKKKLKEAYKLLCRMKVKGCNPDIIHYNTVILGFCREGHAIDACKVLDDMSSNGCLPNLTSYRTLVSGLCAEGLLDEAKYYMEEMMSKGLSPHFSVFHDLIRGLCNVGKVEEACGVLEKMLRHGEAPHRDTWESVVPMICEVDEMMKSANILEEALKIEITPLTRLVEAGVGLERYVIQRIRAKSKRASK